MSYKDYSTEAVKSIMQKTRESQVKESSAGTQGSSALSVEELIEVGAEVGLNSAEVKKAAGVYDHPDISQHNTIGKTHLLIERTFHSLEPKEFIWNKIEAQLKKRFSDGYSDKVRIHDRQFKWSHLNHANHETVVTLQKESDTVTLKISQRLGFWSPKIEGVIHSSYLALLFTGLMFAALRPEVPVVLATFAILWSLQAFIIYSFSFKTRKNKLESMEQFADQIVDHI